MIQKHAELHDGRVVFRKTEAPGDVYFSLSKEEREQLLRLLSLESEKTTDEPAWYVVEDAAGECHFFSSDMKEFALDVKGEITELYTRPLSGSCAGN